MLRLFIVSFLILILGGCSYLHPYRPDIQQGNIISTKKVAELHLGMSQNEVVALLGAPILQNTFANNRLVYVYQLLPNHGSNIKKILTLTFRNGQLVDIQKQI
ncbi:MAG: hypothetical protein A3E87_10195 [Gammaproteobacteria bacterium RIFCSPHIGHO2_12_FULL_35_23]|nr:MAG: hypothetical protein A3E87_10195 [Gammaproteobacteria bacterium RIFCSPHIGHO2_12_FULL_35_23]